MAYQPMPAKPAHGQDWSAMGNALVDNVTQLVTDASAAVTVDRLPAGSVMSTASMSVRPTARTDIRVHWHTPEPPTAVMVTGDTWIPTP